MERQVAAASVVAGIVLNNSRNESVADCYRLWLIDGHAGGVPGNLLSVS